MKSSRQRPLRQDTGRVSRLAVGVLAVLLLLMNVGGWGLVWHSWKTQQKLLEQSLQTGAALIAGAMTPDSLFFLAVSYDEQRGTTDFSTLAEYAPLPSAQAFQESLAEASRRQEGLEIAVLSPRGEIIVDYEGTALEPEPDRWADVDAALIAQANSGDVAANMGSRADRMRRVYYPLMNQDGVVIGMLRVASNQPTPMPFRRIVLRLSSFSILSTVLILFLWWTLNRLIKRSIAAERMAYQSDRLRALGTATAGIAHEIRNPLGIITLSIEELRARVADVGKPDVREALLANINDLQEETARLRELTDQFLNFTRDKSGTVLRTKIDLADAAEKTVRLFQKGAPLNVQVRFESKEQRLLVWFGEMRLRQVLLNLMRNAQEAFGGKPGLIEVIVSRDSDAFGKVEVRDNGPGMDAATLNQVFDPFFTTRAEGTGLGLSLSRALVEAAGGQLTMESAPGKGSTARMLLPLVVEK